MIDNIADDKFSVFLPFEVIEKAGDSDKKEMKIRGVASTTKQDSDDEILEPDGFDVSKFLKSGFLNYNHLASKDPSMIIGEPTKAIAKNGELHIEGVLYPDSEMACKVYETAKVLKKSSKTRSFGFSIEGKALERDPLNPKRITKASITGCAITPSPKNPGTKLEIVKGGIDAFKFETEDGSEFLVDVTDEFGVRTTVDKNFVIQKSQASTDEPEENNDEQEESEDLEKASKGEGSRGGKVIGHTKTGKPIYAGKLAESKAHKDYTAEDHEDAAAAKTKHWHENKTDNVVDDFHHAGEIASHHHRAALKRRQGNAIGETKSGKTIYHDPHHADHGHFDDDDHKDARKAHMDKMTEAMNNNDAKKFDHHHKAALHHWDQSSSLKSAKMNKAEGVQEGSTAEEMDGVTAKESLEGTKKKKKKIEQDKKTFSKAETYEEIFSMFNCNVEDAPHLYQLIEKIQHVLTPDMEKVQISKEAIQKAQEILGLASAPTTSAPSVEDEAKKAEEIKKAEIQKELDSILKKAEELKAQLSGETAPKVEQPKVETPAKVENKIEKAEVVANDDKILKAMDEKFQAIGTLIASKDEEIGSIKAENAELKKGINELSEFNKQLAAKIGMISQQPMDRKSVTTTSFLEKGEGDGAVAGGSQMTTLSLSNKQHRAILADTLFKAAIKDGKVDNELSKAVTTVELGSLGDTPSMSQRLQQRLQSEFKINVVK